MDAVVHDLPLKPRESCDRAAEVQQFWPESQRIRGGRNDNRKWAGTGDGILAIDLGADGAPTTLRAKRERRAGTFRFRDCRGAPVFCV